MTEQLLQQLGLDQKEVSIYLALMRQGRLTPAELAQSTGIKRTTVYSVTKELLARGIIAEDLGSNPRSLVALPPEDLSQLIAKDERVVEEKKRLVSEAVASLRFLARDTKYPVPKITFIEEEDLENYLYKQGKVWTDSLRNSDGIFWGFQDPSLLQEYGEWIDWYWKSDVAEEVSVKLLTTQAPIEAEVRQKGYERRQTKFWAKGHDFTSTTWVIGDHLVFVTTRQHPFYLIDIHDALMAHNLRELFKEIWESIEA